MRVECVPRWWRTTAKLTLGTAVSIRAHVVSQARPPEADFQEGNKRGGGQMAQCEVVALEQDRASRGKNIRNDMSVTVARKLAV
jgi:hypothetical protein